MKKKKIKEAQELFLKFRDEDNDDYFVECYKLIKPELTNKVEYKIKNNEDIPDLVGDAIEYAFANRNRFDPEKGNLLVWFDRMILPNILKKYYRYHNRYSLADQDADEESDYFEDNPALSNISTEEYLSNRIKADQLKKTLKTLGHAKRRGPDYQNVLLLYNFSDYDLQDIASIYNSNDTTIRIWHARAKELFTSIFHKITV